ncbi:MAG: hypothetical protein J5930_06570 [Treponema sp.]|nr:hypothetical protein [Treponema sp.]
MPDNYRHAERSYAMPNEAMPCRTKLCLAERGCVMLNVVACNRIQHLLYKGDPESSSG